LFFGGARLDTDVAVAIAGALELCTSVSIVRAAEKQKAEWRRATSYKQAAPTGFEKKARNRILSSALKDVSNDKG